MSNEESCCWTSRRKANQTVKGHSMCPYCNFEFSSRVDLSDLVRVNHVQDEVCPTQESPIKSVYPCFYCEKEIMNTTDCLEKHHKDCMEPTLSFKHTRNTSYEPLQNLTPFLGHLSCWIQIFLVILALQYLQTRVMWELTMTSAILRKFCSGVKFAWPTLEAIGVSSHTWGINTRSTIENLVMKK